MREEAHFLENCVSPQREHRFVPLANQDEGQDWAKMGPRWAKMRPRWAKTGPRMDYVAQVVSTLGRSWADIVQKLQEEWKMAVVFKMGPRWVQDRSKMSEGGSISRP